MRTGSDKMSEKDAITKEYMQDNEIFADAFNYYLYNGEQVIKPEQLKPLDTAQIVLPYGSGEQSVPEQRYRDVLKTVTAMTDDHAAYLLLGIEDQSEIHNAMPVKNMFYDAGQYVKQVEAAAKSHRAAGDKPETSADFLSGFYKTDKLLPVITLTMYFGADEWTAPRDLHSMLEADENILKFVDNYRIHLIAPADIADENFAKFHTELNLALKYVKYSKNKNKLSCMLQEDAAYRKVSRKTADMLNIVTNSNLNYAGGKESVDMCEAIEGIKNDAREEGRVEGREEGREEGRAEGIEIGVLKTLADLVRDGTLTLAGAATRAKLSVPEFEVKSGLKA